LGYIKVDKDGMAGLGSFGDQLPFEEGNHAMDSDAKTPYVSAAYEIEGVKLETIYGQTKYYDGGLDKKLKEKEFNFSVGYEFIKNLETSLMYVNVDNDVKDESYNAIKAHVAYKF
ncbi:MAG: Opr family porin, partial [Sulfurospirillum sp.]